MTPIVFIYILSFQWFPLTFLDNSFLSEEVNHFSGNQAMYGEKVASYPIIFSRKREFLEEFQDEEGNSEFYFKVRSSSGD